MTHLPCVQNKESVLKDVQEIICEQLGKEKDEVSVISDRYEHL